MFLFYNFLLPAGIKCLLCDILFPLYKVYFLWSFVPCRQIILYLLLFWNFCFLQELLCLFVKFLAPKLILNIFNLLFLKKIKILFSNNAFPAGKIMLRFCNFLVI